jgi:hypothetical protein
VSSPSARYSSIERKSSIGFHCVTPVA